MIKRYRGLGFIGLLLKIIGVFELVLGLVGLVLLPLTLSNADAALSQIGLPLSTPGIGLILGVSLGVLVFLIGLVSGLLTFALGEMINVVIAIEENTRATVILLQAQK
jgi:hypothetical protein